MSYLYLLSILIIRKTKLSEQISLLIDEADNKFCDDASSWTMSRMIGPRVDLYVWFYPDIRDVMSTTAVNIFA